MKRGLDPTWVEDAWRLDDLPYRRVPGSWMRWSSWFYWQERALAWDEAQDRYVLVQLVKDREQLVRNVVSARLERIRQREEMLHRHATIELTPQRMIAAWRCSGGFRSAVGPKRGPFPLHSSALTTVGSGSVRAQKVMLEKCALETKGGE
jgi:hypothetical protein